MSSEIKVDTISENTSANGVAVDGVTIKDGTVKSSISNSTQTTAGLTIDNTVSGGYGAALAFDVHRSDSGNQATAARIYPSRADVWSSDAASDADLNFQVSQDGTVATRMTVSGTGDVRVTDGNLVLSASGHGIDFSAQSDTGTGETASGSVLNDYEQGTFTASCTTEGTDFTTSSRSGASFYTKIGDWVSIQVNWSVTTPSGTSSSGNVVVTGMPFVCNAAGNSVAGVCSFGRTSMPSGFQITGQIYDNESKVRFITTVSGSATQQLQAEGLEGMITPFGQIFISYPCD